MEVEMSELNQPSAIDTEKGENSDNNVPPLESDVASMDYSSIEPGEIIDFDNSCSNLPEEPEPDPNSLRKELNNINTDMETHYKKTKQEIVRVIFSNTENYQHLIDEIKRAISNCVKKHKDIKINFETNDESLIVLDESGYSGNSKNNEISTNADTDTFMFGIDTAPTAMTNFDEIPSYKRSIQNVLDENFGNELEKSQNDASFSKTNSCFNCSSQDHMLRDCPEERNQKKIKRAKKSKAAKTERYHVDVEQRFNHLKPGELSENLRKAFNLSKKEVPLLFYKMRVLGYPPGWLEDAKVAHSGIHLIDSQGNQVNDPNVPSGKGNDAKHKYDISKIIRFPGFNSSPGSNYRDAYKYHRVPRMSPKQDIEVFIKTFGENVVKGYKRKQLKNEPENDNEECANDNVMIEDMDLQVIDLVEDEEDNNEVAKVDESVQVETELGSPVECCNNSNGWESPSLQTLEEEHKMLLCELENNATEIDEDIQEFVRTVSEIEFETESEIVEAGCEPRFVNEPEIVQVSEGAKEPKSVKESEGEKEIEGVAETEAVKEPEVVNKKSETSPCPEVIKDLEETIEIGNSLPNTEGSILQNEESLTTTQESSLGHETSVSVLEEGEVDEINEPEVIKTTQPNLTATSSTDNLNQTSNIATTTNSAILGTPVLKFSPYDKLPSYDEFSKGVCDIINYENLPDSTGKYQKMRKIIQKVREVITKINQDDC